ncbi:DUF397 domain-containing protein [Streptomyces sp. NBC_00102]|uniref:DUF397 domain-containing protein n=1 Tax=Streptomyces sp. NBC_00102 TaxID=2975652 RepID=UPI002255F9B0|nr:DUF397 domain-containing protein [Streptomyces sp. NBC_00102]MCX5398355.1 DUF397 domain-containing protein [Streptomyces sp. NBC_00102]
MRHFDFVKSSYSSGDGECVEVARNVPGAVAVRDSKFPDGPVVVVTSRAWASFQDDARCAEVN